MDREPIALYHLPLFHEKCTETYQFNKVLFLFIFIDMNPVFSKHIIYVCILFLVVLS